MAKEIERKFLVREDSWRATATGQRYRQGYIATARLAIALEFVLLETAAISRLKGHLKG